MPLLSKIEFGSCFVYSTTGTSQTSVWSKRICHAVKQDKSIPVGNPPKITRVIPGLVERMKQSLDGTVIGDFFAANPILVPAPGSSLTKPGTLRPTKLICEYMVKSGLGADLKELLTRTIAVPKAAYSKSEDRPTLPQHFASMSISAELGHATSILVVDDVVTSGSMLLASVSKLRDAFPEADVRAFALIRTMSGGTEVESIFDPCIGTITNRGDRSKRVP